MDIIDQLALLTNSDSRIEVSYQWKLVSTDEYFHFMDITGKSIKIEDNFSQQIIQFVSQKSTRVSDVLNHFQKNENDISLLHIKLLELSACGLFILRNKKNKHSISPADLERFKCQLKHFENKERLGLSNYRIQQNLFNSKVVIIGLGALGSHIAILLAASGIRNFTLIDGDKIELSNLPRQIYYTENEIGQFKAIVIKSKLVAFDRKIKVTPVNRFITRESSLKKYISHKDMVVLCGDEPRGKINAWVGETCFQHKVPYISMAGSWVGPLFVPYKSPCYVCQTNFNSKEITDFEKYVNLLDCNSDQIIPSFTPA